MAELFVFFFFQAEDGIRDGHVTGVQTCALPISPLPSRPAASSGTGVGARFALVSSEIGRASCRERGVDLGGRRIIKKKKKTGKPRVDEPVTKQIRNNIINPHKHNT